LEFQQLPYSLDSKLGIPTASLFFGFQACNLKNSTVVSDNNAVAWIEARQTEKQQVTPVIF
jgi:hypothetical protein